MHAYEQHVYILEHVFLPEIFYFSGLSQLHPKNIIKRKTVKLENKLNITERLKRSENPYNLVVECNVRKCTITLRIR